jgi:hypothetical protein
MSNIQQLIQNTAELSLMRGFPPGSAGLVTHANQPYRPYSCWSFQNELPLGARLAAAEDQDLS